MGLSSQPRLLTQSQFDTYTEDWVQAIVAGPLPATLFEDTTRLLSASLPLDQLLHLLSAVGVRRIKVGFVLLPSAPQGESAFTLALYATDDANNRLSAYYLAGTPWAATSPTGGGTHGSGTPIPLKLAELWWQQWAAAPTIEAAFFQVPTGPLQGYDFDMRYFVDALLDVPKFDDKQLVFGFGLNELYGPAAPTTPGLTRTFGLVAYLASSNGEMVSAPYDIAIPRPPAT